MKKIIVLLLAFLSFEACHKDSVDDLVADSISIQALGISGDVSSFNADDGNWGVKIKSDFKGKFEIKIQSDKDWTVSVDNITVDEELWMTPSKKNGTGNQTISIGVSPNPTTETRKATITITTGGDIPVSKKVTVVQSNKGVLDIKWNAQYLLSDTNMVLVPNERSRIEIGTFNANGDSVKASSSEKWASIEIAQDGKVNLSLEAFNSTGDRSRSTILTLINTNGGINQSIKLTQYVSEGLTDKSTWNIQPGNDSTTAAGGDPVRNIIDGDIHTAWQWDWSNSNTSNFPKTPYVFVIDLGSKQVLNTFELWQVQNATNGYVKDVQFKVSDDKVNWIDLGVYRMSDSQQEAMDKGAEPYIYTLDKTYKTRYIKLVIISNVGDGKAIEGVNNVKNAYLAEFDALLK